MWLLLATTALIACGLLFTTRRSESPSTAYVNGMRAVEENRLDDARSALKDLERHSPSASATSVLQAAILLRMNRPAEALQAVDAVDAQGSFHTPVLLIRGQALYHLGHLAEAEAAFRQIADQQPQNADAHRWLGAIYYDLGAMRAAIDELNVVARLEPDDYRPFRLSALIQKDFEQFVEAAAAYRGALDRNPPDDVRAEIALELGEVYSRLFEHDRALEVLADAPPTAEAFALRAECLWSVGRLDEAREALAQGRRIDPEHRDLDVVEAQLKIDDGQPEAAIALLEPVLRRDPHDFRARYQIAQAWRQAGDEERHKDAMQLMTDSRQLYYRLTELNELAVTQPDDPAIRDELADICRKLNKPELAEMWERAAEALRSQQDPSNAPGA